MCCSCCRAFFAKIFYSALIAGIFLVGLFPTFDIFTSVMSLRRGNFKDAEPFQVSGLNSEPARVKSEMFNILYNSGFYTPDHQCLSAFPQDTFTGYAAINPFKVYVDAIVNGQNKEATVEVKCVGEDIFEDESINIVYAISAGCGFGGIGLAIILIFVILCCCTGCCSCKCCRRGTSEENAALIRV